MTETGQTSKKTAVFAVVAAVIIAAVAVVFSSSREKAARAALINDYGATLDEFEDQFTVALSETSLTDLIEVGPILARAGQVTALDLTECKALVSTVGISQVTTIESLVGINLAELADLTEVNRLPRLRELIFIECPSLTSISDLRGNATLSAVDLTGATTLVGALEFSALPSLTDLTLSLCSGITELQLGASPGLRALFLDGCASLENITGIESAPALTDIDLSNTHALKSIAGLELLPELHLLDLRNTGASDALSIAGKCAPLHVLRLGGHRNITDFSDLSGLSNLTDLNFDASSTLVSLNGLPIENLEFCGVPQCTELTDISALASATHLIRIDLSGCSKVTDLAPLKGMKALQEINLTDCRAIRDIEPLASVPSLAVLQVGGSSVPRALVARLKRINKELIVDFSGANTFQTR